MHAAPSPVGEERAAVRAASWEPTVATLQALPWEGADSKMEGSMVSIVGPQANRDQTVRWVTGERSIGQIAEKRV